MRRCRCLCAVVVGVLFLVTGAVVSVGEEIEAASFQSSGDLIEGWYWLRDASLQDQAWWTFEGIPQGAEDVVLEITCLATDRPNGPGGVPAVFRLGYGFTGSGTMSSVLSVQEVTLPNVSSPTDPLGYTCRGTVVIPRSTPGLAAGAMTVYAERISPSGPHVAFNQESILVRVAGGLTAEDMLVAPSSSCQRTIDGLRALTSGLELPEYLAEEGAMKRGTEFDVNAYFDVLGCLSMEPGYVLDYVYHFEGIGGRPVLYARPEERAPFAAYEDLVAAQGEQAGAYLSHIQIDTTRDCTAGFVQFVILAIAAEQFYLHWHAFYNDTLPVCSTEAVQHVLESLDGSFGFPMSLADQARARTLDVEPRVSVDETAVLVRLVTFTKWGGFVEERFTIARAFPHEILDVQSSPLLEYACGVLF